MTVTAADVQLKNREIYDDTSGPVWQLAIYGAVHNGYEFINLGGARVLDRIGALAGLDAGKDVVELCAGRGAVCRYLAETWGCRITGVEWNPHQAACGRAMLRRAPLAVASRIEIVNADCLAWRPEEPADVVLSMDSMMLLPDVPAVLRHSRSILRESGELYVVTIGAGDAITAATRQFAWEIDGMSSLYSAAEYGTMLEAAGFATPTVTDITGIAIETSERIDAALYAHRSTIVDLAGEEAFRGWVDVGTQYLAAFRRRELAYLLAAAPAHSAKVAITDNAAEPRPIYDTSRIEVSNTRPANRPPFGKEMIQ